MTGFRDLLYGQSAVAPKSGIRRITDVRCTSEMCHKQPLAQDFALRLHPYVHCQV
jgi:hypothetical protein